MNKQKIFYLHIPKTAGSSMNKFLTAQYKEDESLIHIESKVDFADKKAIDKIDNYKLLSGHIQLPQMQRKLKVLDSRTTIATFRIPIEHVISHIAWVRKLGDKGEEGRLKQHNSTVQKIVKKLLTLDLSNASDISKLIKWLEDEKIYLFHDTQTRYLCGGPNSSLGAAQINQALIHMNKLDFVGTTERLKEFQSMLCYRLNWMFCDKQEEKININTSYYGLDIKDETIRKALQPLVQSDNIIYRIAREKFIDDMHRFLVEIEKSKGPRFSTSRSPFIRSLFEEKV
jgi:hypothetical protein